MLSSTPHSEAARQLCCIATLVLQGTLCSCSLQLASRINGRFLLIVSILYCYHSVHTILCAAAEAPVCHCRQHGRC